MRVSPFRITASVTLWVVLMVCLCAFYWWQWLHEDHTLSLEQRQFVVASGESLHSVAYRLHEAEVIRWPNIWRLYARFLDPESIKAGEYLLAPEVSPALILDTLQEGRVVTYHVTLVEGKTFQDFLTALSREDKLTSLLSNKTTQEQLRLLELDVEHPEGWFFPDTYQYVAGATDLSILRRAHAQMRTVLAQQWSQRAPDLPYKSPYEALVMASIIEKETGVGSERREIAGVFVRRLQRGMRLQTDPTVIYGIGQSFDGNITRAHLREATPYNTYTNSGLPPTPIAMPGAAAIHAALQPLPGDTLYFVARGDGSHQFSATLDEHNQAVREYQKLRRASNYRSAPAQEVK